MGGATDADPTPSTAGTELTRVFCHTLDRQVTGQQAGEAATH